MSHLTNIVVLPATRRLELNAFIADTGDVVLVPLPAPAPGTTALAFAFLPNDAANDVVVEASLFAVPPARTAALSVYFATVASQYKGITWMIDGGVAFACIHVDLGYAAVAAAFERLAHALGDTYAEITRIVTGARKRRSRVEREAARIVAPFNEPAPVSRPVCRA